MNVVKGKQVSNLQPLEMNDIVIQPIEEGDTYKYLGQDENINFDGPINKERVTKEYFTRIRKIWTSELSAYSKVTAHISFAPPVLVLTFGILDWSIQDIKDLDIKTRKQLTMSGNFHPNSDIDLLYIQRNLGVRGLRQIQRVFESRIISIRQYLLRNRNRNTNIAYICDEEKDNLLRLGENLQTCEIDTNLNENPKTVSKLFAKADMKAQMEGFQEKQLHGYISTKLERDVNLDKSQSLSWRRDRYIESKTEAYMSAIIEQETPTKYIRKKRSKNTLMSDKRRLCKSNVEDIHHIASSCPQLSSRYYLPLRHNVIAKCVYNKLLINDGQNRKLLRESDQIYNTNDKEY